MFFNNSFYIASHGPVINLSIWISSLFFFFKIFCLSLWFLFVLALEPSAIHWLTCFRVSGCFFVLFWILWMLVTVHKPCHVPHASRITTWAIIFMERLFCVSKEWVRLWSYVFLITCYKMFAKKLLAVRQKRGKRRKKRKQRIRMKIAKLFALNGNLISHISFFSIERSNGLVWSFPLCCFEAVVYIFLWLLHLFIITSNS